MTGRTSVRVVSSDVNPSDAFCIRWLSRGDGTYEPKVTVVGMLDEVVHLVAVVCRLVESLDLPVLIVDQYGFYTPHPNLSFDGIDRIE